MENILVIDDDEKILELVQEVLKNEHYIVETRSYVDNTNIGEFEGFDLILLDIMLPFLDGYEILERIKNIITCPVIFLSAKSSEGAKVKGLMSGADDYITNKYKFTVSIAWILILMSAILILKAAPVESINRELDNTEKEHCQKVTMKILMGVIAFAICCTVGLIQDMLSLISLTTFIILISQYVGILKYKIENSKNKRR